MRTRGRTSAALARTALLMVTAAAAALLAACGPDGGDDPAPVGPQQPSPQQPTSPDPSAPGSGPTFAPPAPPAFRVAFLLDPRLADGLSMGERWVSPPVFRAAAQTGATFTVEARVEGLAAFGRWRRTQFVAWTPSDPDAVSVAPPGKQHVVITVARPGQSTLTVAAGAKSTVLTIDAVQADGVWQVSIAR